MAPASEYATTGGGRLKIKGVQGGRVEKKKKKKKDKDGVKEKPVQGEEGPSAENQKTSHNESMAEKSRSDSRDLSESRTLKDEEEAIFGKTEAERRYNEARRKRLNERLKREGIKAHKERVEELNKYLSNLSEHHDMPKIGPG